MSIESNRWARIASIAAGIVVLLNSLPASAEGGMLSSENRAQLASQWSKLPDNSYTILTVLAASNGSQKYGDRLQFKVTSGDGLKEYVDQHIRDQDVACIEVLNKQHERVIIRFKDDSFKEACFQQSYMFYMFISSAAAVR